MVKSHANLPATLHNQVLQLIEDAAERQAQPVDTKRFGELADSVILGNPKRRRRMPAGDAVVAVDHQDDDDAGQAFKDGPDGKSGKQPSIDELDADVQYYENMLKKCKVDMDRMQEASNSFKGKVEDVRKVYLYGLSTV
jgi:hypothetical protein